MNNQSTGRPCPTNTQLYLIPLCLRVRVPNLHPYTALLLPTPLNPGVLGPDYWPALFRIQWVKVHVYMYMGHVLMVCRVFCWFSQYACRSSGGICLLNLYCVSCLSGVVFFFVATFPTALSGKFNIMKALNKWWWHLCIV